MNAREKLKQFYKKHPTKVDSSLDIDHPQFDSKQYLKQVLQSQPTAGLLSTSNQLVQETRQIDGDIKTMVYDNYSKFISATQTISQMNQDAEHLDQEISSLARRITDISRRTTHLNSQFSQRRKQIELLNQQHLTLQRLQFLYDLPSRLEQLISTNRVLEAARVWARTQPMLEHYEGQTGAKLAGIREDGRLIMEEVQETVKRQWRQSQTGIKEGAECASLLVLLDPQDSGNLWRQYLEVQDLKLRNARQQILDQSLELPPLDEAGNRLSHFNHLYLVQWNALVVGFASQFLKPTETPMELLSPLAATPEDQEFVVGWQVMAPDDLVEAQKEFTRYLEEWSHQYEFVVDSLMEYPEDISQPQHLTSYLWQLDHYLTCANKYPVLADMGNLQDVVDRVAGKWQQQLIDSSLQAVIRDMSERLEYYFDPDVGTQQHQRNSSVVSNTSVNSPTAAHARAVSSTFESLSDTPRRSSIGRRSMTRRSTLQSTASRRRPTLPDTRRYKPWLVATVNRQAPLHVVLADTETWLIQQILEQVNPLLEFVVQHYLDMEASQLLDEDGLEKPVLDLAIATGMRQRFIRTLDKSLGTWMLEWIPDAFVYMSQTMVPLVCGSKDYVDNALREMPMAKVGVSRVEDPVVSLLLARFATDFELTLTQSIYQLCEHAISLSSNERPPQILSGGSSANVSMTNLNPLETDVGSRVQSLTASWLLKDAAGRTDSMATNHSGKRNTMLASKPSGGPTLLSMPSTELSKRWKKLTEQLVKHFIITVGQSLSGNFISDATGGVSQYWLNTCRYLKHIEEDTNALFYDPSLLPPTLTDTPTGHMTTMSNIDRLFAERVDVFPQSLSDPLTSSQIMYYLALQVTKSGLENLRLSVSVISDQDVFQRLVVDVGFIKTWVLRYCSNTVGVRALQNILDDWVATAQAYCIEKFEWPEPKAISKMISDAMDEI